MTKARNRNPYDGSSFDAFLAEHGLLEEVETRAMKAVRTCRRAEATRVRNIGKKKPAVRRRAK